MSITFTNGQPGTQAPKPGTPAKTENPKLKALQQRKKNLDKQIQRIQGPQKSVACFVRRLAEELRVAQEDPRNLNTQIKPLLNKLLLAQIQDRETILVSGQTKKQGRQTLALYNIMLRRGFEITPDHIERLHRESDTFSSIEWTSKGLCVYLWAPYEAPAEELRR